MKNTGLFGLLYLLAAVYAAAAFDGKVWISRDAICTEDITADYKADISDTARLKLTEGYNTAVMGMRAASESILLRGRTPKPFGLEGTVSLWVKTDDIQYQSGTNETEKFIRLFDVPGLLSFGINKTKSNIDFVWKWDRSAGSTQYHDLHIITPQLPAQKWIQFTFRWSIPKGIFNCYLNNTPYRQDENISGLKLAAGQEIIVYASEITFSELTLSDRMYEGTELSGILSGDLVNPLDKNIGVEPLDKLDIEFIIGDMAYSNPLREPRHIRGWHTEGPAKITFDQLGMLVSSERPEGPINDGNIVIWCGDDLPAAFIAKWKFQILSSHGQAIVFFAAKGQNGKNIFDPMLADRDGSFSQYLYGDINSYQITYYSNAPFSSRNNCSLWKNTGFYLCDYGPVVVEPGSKEIYTATLVKIAGRIVMAINNWVIVDFFDDGQRFGAVLDWGKIGFRQMKWTTMRYSDFQVYAIKIPEQKKQPEKTEQKEGENDAAQ